MSDTATLVKAQIESVAYRGSPDGLSETSASAALVTPSQTPLKVPFTNGELDRGSTAPCSSPHLDKPNAPSGSAAYDSLPHGHRRNSRDRYQNMRRDDCWYYGFFISDQQLRCVISEKGLRDDPYDEKFYEWLEDECRWFFLTFPILMNNDKEEMEDGTFFSIYSDYDIDEYLLQPAEENDLVDTFKQAMHLPSDEAPWWCKDMNYFGTRE